MDLLKYWGLEDNPFDNTWAVKYFYRSGVHREALVRLIYVIKQKKAGALIAGGYGTGKTTIANELLSEIEESDNYESVYISNPMLTPLELLQEIAHKLDISDDESSRLKLRRGIEERLCEIAENNGNAVIIVDEAHMLNQKEVLEELRLMMNLHYNDKFLVTIIMLGQLELRDIINSMPQFKQRFSMCYVLNSLEESETKKYIKHRMGVAGASKEIFNDDAKAIIHFSSDGKPRHVNNICDMALLVGAMRNVDYIGGDIIREVIKDMEV